MTPAYAVLLMTVIEMANATCSGLYRKNTGHTNRCNDDVIYYSNVNPLSPHDALKHHFASLKNYLIPKIKGVLDRKCSWSYFININFFFIYHPLRVIFIHCKSKIATAIRGRRAFFSHDISEKAGSKYFHSLAHNFYQMP